jgi:hypothetical protein
MDPRLRSLGIGRLSAPCSIMLSFTFVYIGPAGKRLTQAEGLAGLEATRGFQVLSETMVVHLHGDTAVVTEIYETKGVERGQGLCAS